MQNNNGQKIVIPFYVRNVHQPILSVTRLAELGFTLQFGDNPNIQHPKGFTARLEQRDSLYYLDTRLMTLPDNLELNIEQADGGTTSAMIAPTTALRGCSGQHYLAIGSRAVPHHQPSESHSIASRQQRLGAAELGIRQPVPEIR